MTQMMKRGWAWLAALALVAVGCTQPPTTLDTTGSVQLVAVIQAAAADDVTKVLVTVTAPDMDPVTGSLARTGGTWSGNLTSIPVGDNRTFTAEAFDAAGKKLFGGQATGVTVSVGATAVVNITLQETTPKPGFENDAPRITALVASTNRVATGGTVALQVTAMDPNPGDTLIYAWTASAGGFDTTTRTSATWTAPLVAGSATVTVTVTDSRGASAALSLTLSVEGTDAGVPEGGSASVGAVLNSWPQVTRITASSSFLAAGESTTVEASASDNDGDALSYSWSTWCSGTWSSTTSRTATFTAADWVFSDSCMSCPLQVTVTDGRGGLTTGSLYICLGKKPTPSFPPRITSATQSATTVATGGTVTFRVAGSDPMGGSLTFDWAAVRGTLGTPLSGIASSEVVWTAPSCVPSMSSTVGISAVVKNTAGLSTTQLFSVAFTGPACPASTWVSTGAMATSRESHSATLLSSGKVLVAGGNDGMDISATAELYDPASGLWSATGRMSQGRYGHTATPLPSGKVLVAGGYTSGYIPTASAELYDPATGTWASVASMLRPSIGHRATLLPSGKVLVTGGLLGGGSPTTEVELYDPVTNAWTMGASMSMPRLGHSAVLLASGKVLVVGTGSGAAPSTTLAELYDPATGTWNSLSMLQAHETPVVALLKSGKVLVADVSGGGVRTAEVYDPVAGTWTSTGISSEVRSGARVVTLSSGKVLVAGGFFAGGSGSFSYLASAELYDPATGTWSSAGSMSVGRGSHTATLLPSGDVLFAGGSSGGGGIVSTVSSAELYLP